MINFFSNQFIIFSRGINPAENWWVSFLTRGEGFHNYHHTFPWDYKAAELPIYTCNLSLKFIDFFAKFGWAYDLKSVSPDMIQRRVQRTGDGNHNVWRKNDVQKNIDQKNYY